MAVDLPGYVDTIRERFGLPADAAVELRQGQFHDVVLTETTAYRFPCDEAGRRSLKHRAAVLTALNAQDLGFAVPEPVAPVVDEEPIGRCVMVTTRVPGQPLPADMARRQPEACGDELGRILTALASATEQLRDLVGEAGLDRWEGFADGVERELFPLMSIQGRRRARRELDDVLALATPAKPVLVHGDLGGSNLQWEQSPRLRLVGVLDWDELFLGSPANDIASIAATYGWSVARRAARVVADPERAVSEAAYIRATFALQQALPAALSGDPENLDDGLEGYR